MGRNGPLHCMPTRQQRVILLIIFPNIIYIYIYMYEAFYIFIILRLNWQANSTLPNMLPGCPPVMPHLTSAWILLCWSLLVIRMDVRNGILFDGKNCGISWSCTALECQILSVFYLQVEVFYWRCGSGLHCLINLCTCVGHGSIMMWWFADFVDYVYMYSRLFSANNSVDLERLTGPRWNRSK